MHFFWLSILTIYEIIVIMIITISSVSHNDGKAYNNNK